MTRAGGHSRCLPRGHPRCPPRKTGGCTRMRKMRREKPSSVPRLKPGRGEMLPCVPSLGFSPGRLPKKALPCTTFSTCTPRKPAPCTNGQSPAAPRMVQRAEFLAAGPPDSVQRAAFLSTSPPGPVQRAAFLGAPSTTWHAPPLLSAAHGISHDTNDHDKRLETP